MTTALEWTAAHRPTTAQLRKATDDLLTMHGGDWDSSYVFAMLAATDSGELAPVAIAMLAPNIDSATYPDLLPGLVAKTISSADIDEEIVALGLQVEMFHTEPGEDGTFSPEQLAAAAERKISELPDRREACWAMTFGVGGGFSLACKYRDNGELIYFDSSRRLAHEDMFTKLLSSLVHTLPEVYTLTKEDVAKAMAEMPDIFRDLPVSGDEA